MQHKFAIADHHTLYDPVEHQPTLYETDEGDGKSEMSGEGK